MRASSSPDEEQSLKSGQNDLHTTSKPGEPAASLETYHGIRFSSIVIYSRTKTGALRAARHGPEAQPAWLPLRVWLVGGRGSPCPCDKHHTGRTHSEGVGSAGHCRLLSARAPGFGVRTARPAFSVTTATASGVKCVRTLQIVP